MDPRHALARTAAQQAIDLATFVALSGTPVAFPPRILAWFA